MTNDPQNPVGALATAGLEQFVDTMDVSTKGLVDALAATEQAGVQTVHSLTNVGAAAAHNTTDAIDKTAKAGLEEIEEVRQSYINLCRKYVAAIVAPLNSIG